MLSRRDKLLIQPWEERRYRDHRAKVTSALPAIDAGAPPPRPHVALKLKKWRRELDRTLKVQRDNYAMLQRLNQIMSRNRLDNHRVKPPYNGQQKVGLFYDVESLNNKLTARPARGGGGGGGAGGADDSEDSYYNNVKCYACDMKKKHYKFGSGKRRHQDFLPTI